MFNSPLKNFFKREIWISCRQHILVCNSVASEWMWHFQNQKQNFKQKYYKNIHSQEAKKGFKGHEMAEGFSPTPSVSLTGLLKSCLNHRKKCPSLTSYLDKGKKTQCKFSQIYWAKAPEEKETSSMAKGLLSYTGLDTQAVTSTVTSELRGIAPFLY